MATQVLPAPQRRKGFTPFPNDVLLDWPRLMSGNAQIFTVMYINSETTGAARARGTQPPYWSRPISTEEFAGFARCTVRAIQLAIDDLVARKVIERKGATGSVCRYHLPFETWPALADRPSTVVPIESAEEPEEETEEEAAARAKGAIPVFTKPQRLRGGARPRPKELPAAASSLRVTADSEVEYSGTLCNGILSLEFKIPKGEYSAKRGEKDFAGFDSKPNRTHAGVVDDKDFKRFVHVAREVGLPFSGVDLGSTYQAWQKLTLADRAAAIQGLTDRQAAGEYDNPTFRPLPQNYLKRRMFERVIRKPAGAEDSKAERFRRAVAGARKIAQDIDRREGRS
jgi:hypothetical protein